MNIFEAIEKNNIQKVKNLLDSGVNINVKYDEYDQDSYNNDTPLLFACLHNRIEIVKLLLTYPNIDINYINKDGFTPLNTVSFNGFRKIASLLLSYSKDIDVNIRDVERASSLDLACEMNNTSIVELLLTHPNSKDKIDVNNEFYEPEETDNNFIVSPLHIAIEKEPILLFSLLLGHPRIDVNSKDITGQTPLEKAVLKNKLNIVNLLLTHPKTLVNTNKILYKSLHPSVNIEIFNSLLSYPKIDVNSDNILLFLIKQLSSDISKIGYFNYMNYLKKFKILIKKPKLNLEFDINMHSVYYENIPEIKYLMKKRFPHNIQINQILDTIDY